MASTFSTSPDIACVSAAQAGAIVSSMNTMNPVPRFPMRCSWSLLLLFANRLCRALFFGRDLNFPGPTQIYRRSFQLSVIPGKFLDFDELLCAYIREVLPGIAGRPPDFQIQDLCRFAQSDVLLHGVGAERTAAIDGAVNRTNGLTLVLHRHFDLSPNSRPVRFDSHQTHIDPIVPAARVFEEPQGVRIRRYSASDFRHDVFIAAARKIRERDTVSFVQFPGTR